MDEINENLKKEIEDLIKKNGGKVVDTLDEVVDYLNKESLESIKEQRDYYKKRWEHDSHYWNLLIKQIIPEGWYSPYINDTWSAVEEEYSECVRRLNRKFVQRIIKKGKF